jgi:N-acetylglutamate synthase-like GNAT family acetyltransferase
MSGETSEIALFSEKAFYLAEFREQTLAIACRGQEVAEGAQLSTVLDELERNRTRVVLLTADARLAERLGAGRVDAPTPRALGPVWRSLRRRPRTALLLESGDGFATACRELSISLGVAKLVFLDALGALARGDGSRVSFVDLAELTGLLADPVGDAAKRAPLLREVEAALRNGVPAVNVCTAEGLDEELFSYAGSGTLFTCDRYVDVRRLGIDDLDAADDLIARGVAEGYLAERDESELDRVFAGGFGAFVEGRHLAGIGALIPHPESRTGEIASLYTLTRFLGEGIGGHLVPALCAAASEQGYGFVFACTTTERVARFFERHGFRRVAPEEIPSEKWRDYDASRRPHVICLRNDLGGAAQNE